MTTEFSKMRDHWAEVYVTKSPILSQEVLANFSLDKIAEECYKFADAMMKEAGYDPDSTD